MGFPTGSPTGFPMVSVWVTKAFKVSIRDMDHLGFLRPLHHCFGGLLEARQLQLSLADSHLEDPIRQQRGFL